MKVKESYEGRHLKPVLARRKRRRSKAHVAYYMDMFYICSLSIRER